MKNEKQTKDKKPIHFELQYEDVETPIEVHIVK